MGTIRFSSWEALMMLGCLAMVCIMSVVWIIAKLRD